MVGSKSAQKRSLGTSVWTAASIALLIVACSSSGGSSGDAPDMADNVGDAAASSSSGSSGTDAGGSSGKDAGHPTDAGHPDATVDAGDSGAPPNVSTFLAELAVFRTGGTIAAANGAPAVVVVLNPDGSRTVTIAGKKGPRILLQWTSARSYTMKTDANEDGVIDEQTTATTTAGVTTTVTESDLNLSGVFNFRNTTTSQDHVIYSIVEEILPLETTFATTSSYSGPDIQFAGKPQCVPAQMPSGGEPKCLNDQRAPAPKFCAVKPPAHDRVPCDVDPRGDQCVYWVPVGTVWSSSDTNPQAFGAPVPDNLKWMSAGPYMCTGELGDQLTRVLARSFADLGDLQTLNSGRWSKVMTALATQPLFYGCGVPKVGPASTLDGVVAATNYANFDPNPTGGTQDSPDSFITVFSPTEMANGDDYLEEVLVHEWFHFAGDSHPHDGLGNHQRDWIYSCSRIVNKGRAFAQGFYLGDDCCDASSARDFATCVSAEQKVKYGVQNIFVETSHGAIEVPNGSLTSASDQALPDECFNGSDGSHSKCTCSLERVAAYCDQVTLTEADALSKFGMTAAGNSLRSFNCCEACDSTTPLTTVCATKDPANAPSCIPVVPTICGLLPKSGSIATGPTLSLRNPEGAFLEGNATYPLAGQGLNCPPVTGYLY